MAIKEGKDYLYLVWKCGKTRRQYIVGQLTKNGEYEFQYNSEIKDAMEAGFLPLVSFDNLEKVYRNKELFPVFSSRLPDRKRKDIDRVRHYLGCAGSECGNAIPVTRGDEVFLKREPENLYDNNAVQAVNECGELLGYIPRYYCQAFIRLMEEGKTISCHVTGVDRNKHCDECISIMVKVISN